MQMSLTPCLFTACLNVRLRAQSGWTFRIFLIFFCSAEGKRESEAPGGGGMLFYIENPSRGGVSRGVGAGGGCEGPGVNAGNFHTICACRALVVGKKGFVQEKF